jgi:hypothetical protein
LKSVEVIFKLLIISLLLFFSNSVFSDELMTRYGKLSIDEENAVIYLNEKPVEPAIDSISSFAFEKKFQIGWSDVVLLNIGGGSGCAAKYMFLIVTSAKFAHTNEFGNCSDLPIVKQQRNKIIVKMLKPKGSGYEKYIYSDGVVTQNGKLIK